MKSHFRVLERSFYLILLILLSQITSSKLTLKERQDYSCQDLILFIETFKKANMNLDELYKKFLDEKETYNKLINQFEKEENIQEAEKYKQKSREIYENFLSKIEQIKLYLDQEIKETEKKLTEECRNKIETEYKTTVDHVKQVMIQLKAELKSL